jgi:ABC-2 type transport system permease protein
MGVLNLALKDLLQVWRDKGGLFWLLAFPVIYAGFFGTIFSGGGGGPAGEMAIAVVDRDQTPLSRAFVARLASNEALRVRSAAEETAREDVRKGRISAYLVIEAGYGEGMGFGGGDGGGLQVSADPSRQAEAGYLRGILMSTWFEVIREELLNFDRARTWIDTGRASLAAGHADAPEPVAEILRGLLDQLERLIDTVEAGQGDSRAGWSGPPVSFAEVQPEAASDEPRNAFEFYFPIALLWSMFGSVMVSALSLVRERVSGTMLRLRVSPLSRAAILGGKGLACFLTALGVMTLLILLGHFVFGVRLDHPGRLALALTSTALCFVGITMLLASLARTEEAAGGSASATLLIMMMIGGAMVPRFVMPGWLKSASHLSPVKWGILAIEGGTWRGFTLGELLPACGVLLAVGISCYLAGVVLMRRYQG